MNFIKRAFWSVSARKGRTLLQVFVFTAICVLVISGLSIRRATAEAVRLARQSLGSDVTLQLDAQALMERAQVDGDNRGGPVAIGELMQEPVALADVEFLQNSPYVLGYNVLSHTFALADDFDIIEATAEVEGNLVIRGGGMDADVNLQGVLNSELANSFQTESTTLVAGRHFTAVDRDYGVVLIEQTLANENELVVGDTITISGHPLEIVGIYEATVTAGELALPLAAALPFNRLYTPYSVANALKGLEATVDSATFFIDDPLNVDAFIEWATAESEIDFTTFALDANNQLYQQLTGPISNVASSSQQVVYLVSIAGSIILGLIVMLSIRERKHELGVLLAIGEGKARLVGQMVVELLVVAVFALGFSVLSGNFVAEQLGQQLLENQLATHSEAPPARGGRMLLMGGNPLGMTTAANPITELDINLTAADFVTLAAIGIGVTLVATVVPALSVLRLQPKTILTKPD